VERDGPASVECTANTPRPRKTFRKFRTDLRREPCNLQGFITGISHHPKLHALLLSSSRQGTSPVPSCNVLPNVHPPARPPPHPPRKTCVIEVAGQIKPASTDLSVLRGVRRERPTHTPPLPPLLTDNMSVAVATALPRSPSLSRPPPLSRFSEGGKARERERERE